MKKLWEYLAFFFAAAFGTGLIGLLWVFVFAFFRTMIGLD